MRIASVIDYWREILNIRYCEKDEMLFFRGHSDKSYRLLPGAMRGDGERQESEFYHNIMVEYPEEFKKGEHLSNLVKMQHYCHLTRLLDLTTNPLMALYFASEQYSDKDGQVLCFKVKKSDVLHHTSDKAMMLACLPCFNFEDRCKILDFCRAHLGVIDDNAIKNSNAMQRFLHEVRSEFSAFETCTVGEHLLESYFVQTYKNNERIKRQSGAFLICGLDKERLSKKEQNMLRIDIAGNAKKEILRELRMAKISDATVYPDFERRAMQFRHLKVNWVNLED